MIQLISCDNCGVVLDTTKLVFPEDIRNDDPDLMSEHYNFTKCIWDRERGKYVPKIDCPVCQSPVPQP